MRTVQKCTGARGEALIVNLFIIDLQTLRFVSFRLESHTQGKEFLIYAILFVSMHVLSAL